MSGIIDSVTHAGFAGEVELPPLPGASVQGGPRCTRRWKVRSDHAGLFLHTLMASGASDADVVSDDGVMAEVHAHFANYQAGPVSATVPQGDWSIAPSGQRTDLFNDPRFAALDVNAQLLLKSYREDPRANADLLVGLSGDALEFARLVRLNRNEIENADVIVTRRIPLPAGFSGTIGWGWVGYVFEDNATFQASEGVPDSIMDEFVTAGGSPTTINFQWLMRPFTKQVQRDRSATVVLSYWGAVEGWDTFLYPNRL